MKRSLTLVRMSVCFVILFGLVAGVVAIDPGSVGAQSGSGSVRVFFIRDGRIAAARRSQTPQDISIFDGALIELLRGPRPDERAAGLSTAFNEFIDLESSVELDEEEQIATVNFGPEAAELSDANRILGMAQVVYTLTQFEEINSVAFQVDGVDVPALDGEGVALDRAAKRSDYEAVTAAIFVEAPEVLTTVRSPIRIRGTANTFEATFNYALYDADNALLAEGFVTATSGTGTRGRFSESIEYELEEAGRGTLIVYEASAKDGSWINVVAIPLTLRATVAPTATPTPTATASATPSATATGTAVVIASQTATNTPPPVATNQPTNTARPTDIPAATQTSTAVPTETPVPSSTPKPTETPAPTATPKPTQVPTSSMTIFVLDCPPDMSIDNLNPDECGQVFTGFDFRLSSTQHDIELTLRDALRAGLGYRWTDLPHGTYLLENIRLPDGSLTFFIPRSASVQGSAGTGYTISIDERSNGNLEVTIYILNRWVEIAPF